MSVRTSTFGGIYLTGDDAKNFQKAISVVQPNKAAVEALNRGRALVASKSDGRILVTVRRKP